MSAKGLDISLAALQRQDPYIKNIVDVASQVALYTFNNRANEWEKTEVEGALFVYTRLASPRHGFTIMNRLSMKNLTEPITKDLDFQLQHPFLLYRNARCKDTLILCHRRLGQFYMLVICCHVKLNCLKHAKGHLVAVSHHWKEVWSHLNSWNGEERSSFE
ncbi:hypothetical protein fugu_019713 [Takifugu bimaculatus]|uniref:5'-(N(7)-methylguanosine 5'-triphospho)-[mRNA] hydrolase n=1 Tax=Takifugu bimaculatus TaxID=433685 RepID=A0A4Z2BGB6_9TELE|nr:hypothetical protein fugu_019713 [Takifugu bimaculatus]